MAGLDKKVLNTEVADNGSESKKSGILQSVAFATALLTTQIQANDLLKQCDGIDRQGVIHEDKKNGKINGFPEKVCVKKIKIAQKEKEVKEGKIILAQMDMSIENLKKELEKVEKELEREEKELKKSKDELKDRRDWLKKQIKKMQQSFS